MKGSCLCGAIEIATANRSEFEVCHCSMCRRWAGGPLFAVQCGSEVTFRGEEKISIYPSSDWAERGFCSVCGTHLFYHLLPTDEYALPVGLLQASAGFEMGTQIFIDEKPHYYEFANETPRMTGAQVFAAFSQGDS